VLGVWLRGDVITADQVITCPLIQCHDRSRAFDGLLDSRRSCPPAGAGADHRRDGSQSRGRADAPQGRRHQAAVVAAGRVEEPQLPLYELELYRRDHAAFATSARPTAFGRLGHCVAEERHQEALGLFRTRFHVGQPAQDLRSNLVTRVERVVDPGDEVAHTEAPEWGRFQPEILQESNDLRRVRQCGERRSVVGCEYEEVEPHSDGEVKQAHQIEQLPGGVTTPQKFGVFCVLHMAHDLMTVLDVGLLHRHEHDVSVVAGDDEIGGVR